jgi:hypothetical protein
LRGSGGFLSTHNYHYLYNIKPVTLSTRSRNLIMSSATKSLLSAITGPARVSRTSVNYFESGRSLRTSAVALGADTKPPKSEEPLDPAEDPKTGGKGFLGVSLPFRMLAPFVFLSVSSG